MLRSTARRMRSGCLARGASSSFFRGRDGLIYPSAGEAGLLQAFPDIRILAHRFPDEIAAVVLYHRDDRALIYPQIHRIAPADIRHHLAGPQRTVGKGETRVEGVDETVFAINVIAPG